MAEKMERGCPMAYMDATPKRFRYMPIAELEAFFAQFDLSSEEAKEMAEATIKSRNEVV